MKIQIETPRLLIREIQIDDVDDLFEMDSDPEVHKYIDQTPVESKDEIVEAIQKLQNQYEENRIGRWAVVDKNTNEMLGWCGLKYFREPLNGHANIYEHGYRFKQKHWAKGYATESSKAILDWGFKNLNAEAFYAITDPGHEKSMQVLKKLGFKFKGFFHFDYVDLEIQNCTWFELKKSDWK